jgi:DNA-binding response OmpR family regulator
MATNAGKLLVVESDEQLRASIVTALNEAGYEVSTDVSAGM